MVGVKGEEKICEQCIGKGATGYILKPFSTDKVTAMIKSVLQG
jgi:DNA-binding NarL/FixJ family response regulator